MNRVIIAGGRDLPLSAFVIEKVEKILSKLSGDIELITGTADGADQIAYKFKNKYPIKEFPADWGNLEAEGAVVRYTKKGKPYNAVAGHMRNEQMAEYATHLILFWDGKSTGSKDMLDRAIKHKLKRKVISYERRRRL